MIQTPYVLLTSLLSLGAASAPDRSHHDATSVRTNLERAYGGPQLRRLRSLRVFSDRRLAWPGQGQTAAFVEFATDRQHKYFDLRRKHGSVERWIHQTGNVYHNRYVVDARGATTIDYTAMTYRRHDKGTFFGSFAGDYRMCDLLLAFHLVVEAQDIEYKGEQFYEGRLHDVVTLSVAPDTPQLEVFVSRSDGLIRRLRMQRELGVVNILFASHVRHQGVRYSRESRAYVGSTLVEYEHDLSLAINMPVARRLKIESNLRPAAASVDTSQMTVEMLVPGVYHVGRDDYSMFARTNDGYIAVNTAAGLKARYKALIRHTTDHRPLAHAIVTHHHQDHMSGIQDAIDLGAKLHVTQETERAIRTRPESPKSPAVRVLRDGDTIGPLRVYVRPTAHAVENAFVHHPDGSLLFQDDHYHGLLVDGPTWAQPTAVALHAIIGQLGIKVDRLLSGHARKAERWPDFEAAIRRTRPRNLCPARRRICRDK